MQCSVIDQGGDSNYYGTVAVGTPAVAYDVILDTGSSDFWLASSECASGCPNNIQTYDGLVSTTFSNLSTPFSIQYAAGFARGYLATDTFQMAGFEVTSQVFGTPSVACCRQRFCSLLLNRRMQRYS